MRLNLCEAFARNGPTLNVGTGQTQYEPVEDGGEVAYYRGVQGGWHIFGSFWAESVIPGNLEDFADPENPIVSFEVLYRGEVIGGYQELPRPLLPMGGDNYALVGDTLVLDVQSDEELLGISFELTVTLLDSCGTVLEDDRTVILVAGEEE